MLWHRHWSRHLCRWPSRQRWVCRAGSRCREAALPNLHGEYGESVLNQCWRRNCPLRKWCLIKYGNHWNPKRLVNETLNNFIVRQVNLFVYEPFESVSSSFFAILPRMMYICIGCKSWWIRTPLTRFYSPIEKSVRMKMSFYKLLIISNLWGYLTACHAGGREFEPRPHRKAS